jgi:hypothetical protein
VIAMIPREQMSTLAWGIEPLRDGDRISEHESRFREGGAYHPWLVYGHMKEYVILDFCNTRPDPSSSKLWMRESDILGVREWWDEAVFENHRCVIHQVYNDCTKSSLRSRRRQSANT